MNISNQELSNTLEAVINNTKICIAIGDANSPSCENGLPVITL